MIVIAEEDDLCGAETFNMFMRNLWALFNYDFAKNIRGLIIGRFMQNSFVDMEELKQNYNLLKLCVIFLSLRISIQDTLCRK